MGHEPRMTWRPISPDDITNPIVKAEGTGAVVFQGFLSPQNPHEKPIPVALRRPRITSTAALARFEDELHLRSELSHPNILPLLAACSTPPHYCTVSPWMKGGTLFDLIHTRTVDLSFERLVHMSLQLAEGMAYLHKRNLVHRDLKTANILVDQYWKNLVIADLDLLADVTQLQNAATDHAGRALHRGPSNGRLSHMVGTLVYMAPEVLSGKPHSFAADVYAYGITINEMAAAAVPFVDRKMPVPELHTVLETRFNEVRLRSAIVKNNLRPVLAPGISSEFREIIESCWHPDVARRPSFEQIVDKLQSVLECGTDYLKKYMGSTLPSAIGKGDNHAQTTTQKLLEEFREASADPAPPSWRWQTPANKGANITSRQQSTSGILNVSAALSSTCGERGEDSMEDRSLVLQNLAGFHDTHLFAVFDGHAGQSCAEFAMQQLPGALFRSWANDAATPESALIHAFEDVDYAFLNSTPEKEQSGCTALAALLVDTKLYVANAGDCRCVLGKTDGSAVALSKDHVATDFNELARINARGGFVTVTGRVQGCLMVSRAMGDRFVKRYITATPDVQTHDVEDKDDFLILASDGLWDVVSNQEAVSFVRSTVRVPEMAAKRLALKAIELGSDDNVSVIVVFLRGNVSFSSL